MVTGWHFRSATRLTHESETNPILTLHVGYTMTTTFAKKACLWYFFFIVCFFNSDPKRNVIPGTTAFLYQDFLSFTTFKRSQTKTSSATDQIVSTFAFQLPQSPSVLNKQLDYCLPVWMCFATSVWRNKRKQKKKKILLRIIASYSETGRRYTYEREEHFVFLFLFYFLIVLNQKFFRVVSGKCGPVTDREAISSARRRNSPESRCGCHDA